mgnify:CR=1 FL=1
MTSTKRIWSTSGATTGPIPTDRVQLVSPKGCLAGAYRLIALQGLGAEFVQRVSFIWAASSALPPPPPPSPSPQPPNGTSYTVTGPFGNTDPGYLDNFDHLPRFSTVEPITNVAARSGALLYAFQVGSA